MLSVSFCFPRITLPLSSLFLTPTPPLTHVIEDSLNTHIKKSITCWCIYTSYRLSFSLLLEVRAFILSHLSIILAHRDKFLMISSHEEERSWLIGKHAVWIALSGIVSMATGLWWRATSFLFFCFFLKKYFFRAVFPSSHTLLLLHSLASTSPNLSHSSSRWKITGRIKADTFPQIPQIQLRKDWGGYKPCILQSLSIKTIWYCK